MKQMRPHSVLKKPETGQRILLVEDDTSMGFLLTEFLEHEGYEVKLCRDGLTGLAAFQKNRFDLCILDVMMTQMDGFALAQKIRSGNTKTPFLFLTARSLKEDKLKGFALGAEDYITKPFDEEELLCRIRALLRRSISQHEMQESARTQFIIASYTFDASRQELSRGENTWRMTEKESEVLRLLCIHMNQILRRDFAVERIYGKWDYFLGRSFDVFISKIRKMLQDDPSITIENVFGVGFILSVDCPGE